MRVEWLGPRAPSPAKRRQTHGNRLGSSLSSIPSTLHQATVPGAEVLRARPLLSLVLVWMLVCQTMVPPQLRQAQAKPHSESTSSSQGVPGNDRSWLAQLALLANGWATGAVLSEGSLWPTLEPVAAPVATTGIAVVRHAPSINGNSRVEGSLRQLIGESVTLNGGAVITEDLQVPGTPKLLLNGNPTFGGTVQGTGSSQPTNYQVTLNGGTTVLGHLVTRTDPISLASVPAPPASQGTRNVTITAPGQSAGNFATLRDLTLNGNVGMFTVPPGTYRNFIANGGGGFVFGISGATQPSTYNLGKMTLNGQSQLQIVGPVNLTLRSGLTLNASMGSASNPAWLNLQVSSGGVTLNGGSSLYAVVKAPAGTVIINGNAQLIGTVACDRLTINGGGLLRLTESALPPVNQPPVVSAGANQTITLPGSAALNGSAMDDGLPQGSSVTASWSKLSGPGNVNFANANNAVTTATFSQPGTYVLRLTASDSQLTDNSDMTITVIPQNYPPTVNAGADRTITLPSSATLNGSVTDDGLPAGSTLAITWSKVSGPGTVTFGNPNVTVTTAAFSESGSYVLRLTASDSELTTSDDVVVIVIPENHAPNVDAGADQTITLPNVASLNGSVSDDGLPVGSTLTTLWSQVSGPAAVVFANANVTVTTASFSEVGTYVLRLTVNDSELTAADDLTLTLIDSRVPPIADFVVPQSSGTAGAFVIAPAGSAAVAQLLDSDISTFWTTSNLNNQFATLQFFDQELVFIDRVRLQSANGVVSNASLKDFDVQVSATTSNDTSFVTVFSGTLFNTGQLQEFVFPGGPARARYIKLLLKNNYGSPSNIQLATFNPVAVGSADNIISLPGQTNASLSQSPGLIANGAAIYDSSYPGGSASPNGLLGYNNGGWFTTSPTNQFAIIQLAGGKLYTINGIKMATTWDLGFGSTTAVRNFEVWVSATTPDDTSFTKVLSANATFIGGLQTFFFPGGPVQARYVKYVPLTNGGSTSIRTQCFDVIAEGVGQVLSASGQNQNVLNPAEAAFDSDIQSIWFSPGNAITNVWVKTALADGATQKVYGVRINPVNDFTNGQRGPKDFDIRVSATTADDSAFTTVYSGTLANTFNGGTQEFLFSVWQDARNLLWSGAIT